MSAGKPWHGELIVEGDALFDLIGRKEAAFEGQEATIVWYSRSFPMEPIQMAREDGTWEEGDLVVLHKQAIRGWWKCTRAQADALLNPDEKPIDPALERELVKVREAQQ